MLPCRSYLKLNGMVLGKEATKRKRAEPQITNNSERSSCIFSERLKICNYPESFQAHFTQLTNNTESTINIRIK